MTEQLSSRHESSAVRGRSRWGAVAAVAVATVLVSLDMSVVAVVLPELGHTFGASPGVAQWAILAYMIPLVALSVPAGRWLDRAGPRPAYLLAVVGFGAASLLIAFAPTWWVLVAGRGLQGAFGALVGVVGVPIIAAAVREDQRGRALGIVLTLIPLSGVVGPALGGVLADAWGWRAIFVINVPVVAVAVAGGWRTIPVRAGARTGLPWPGRPAWRESALLATAAAATFLAMDLVARPGVMALIGAAALILVGGRAANRWWRSRDAADVVTLWRSAAFRRPLLALPLVTTGAGAVNFLVPYLLAGHGHSTIQIGAALLAFGVGMAVCSPLAGPVADRIGYRPVAALGAGVTLLGCLSLLTVGPSSGPTDLAWRLTVIGVGHGLFASPNAAAVMAATPAPLMGLVSGFTALLRTFGFALGPALGALTWTVVGDGLPGFVAGSGAVAIGAAVALILSARTASRAVSVSRQ